MALRAKNNRMHSTIEATKASKIMVCVFPSKAFKPQI
jgi:hypothetical protein